MFSNKQYANYSAYFVPDIFIIDFAKGNLVQMQSVCLLRSSYYMLYNSIVFSTFCIFHIVKIEF